MIHSKPALHFS